MCIVTSIPFVIGNKWGMNEKFRFNFFLSLKTSGISAECLWPLIAYGLKFSLISANKFDSTNFLPAPEIPDLASITNF